MIKLCKHMAVTLIITAILLCVPLGTAGADTGSQSWVMLPIGNNTDYFDYDGPQISGVNIVYPMLRLDEAIDLLDALGFIDELCEDGLTFQCMLNMAGVLIDEELLVDIEGEDCAYWVSATVNGSGYIVPLPAECNVNFPYGSWNILFLSTTDWIDECTGQIGGMDSDGNFYAISCLHI